MHTKSYKTARELGQGAETDGTKIEKNECRKKNFQKAKTIGPKMIIAPKNILHLFGFYSPAREASRKVAFSLKN
jgi:hypothetical protein